MARVGQFKALGSALGGYKKTLYDVQSKDYAKKYADVQAQEKVSLYNEIGGTVANIIGIAQEAKRLKKISPLKEPGRPSVGADESYGEMQPDEISSEDFGFLDANERQDLGIESDVTGTILDTDALQMRGPAFESLGSVNPPPSQQMAFKGGSAIGEQEYLRKSGKIEERRASRARNFDENISTNKKSTSAQDPSKVLDETKELYEQTLSSDDKAFNAMNTYDSPAGPNVGQKTAVSDIMSSTESQGFFDSSTGQFVKQSGPRATVEGEKWTGGHYDGKIFRDNEDFTRTKMGEIPGLMGGRESTRTGKAFDVTRQYDFVDTAGDTTTYDVTGRSNKSVRNAKNYADDLALYKGIEGRMSDFPIAKPNKPSVSANAYKKADTPDPITDDMAFDKISDPSLGDFDMSKLPSVDPVRDSVLNKFKKSGASDEKIEQLLSEFAAVETGGRNIKQSGGGPGEGFFQFEGAEGSNEFKTALQRMKNMYDPSRNISGMKGAKYPKWIDEALKHGSAMKLSKDQQKSLLLANLFMKEGSDSLLQKGFGSGDFSELYTDMHYAGAKGDSSARAQKIQDYKNRRKDKR